MLNNKEMDTDTLNEYQAKEHGHCLRMSGLLEIKQKHTEGQSNCSNKQKDITITRTHISI